MQKPYVSIIVTTKNEADVIRRLLQSCKKQTYKNIEIIVVDNNSIDKTPQIASKYTDKVFNKGPERSAQRNFGAKKASGEYLFFLDADMELSKNVVRDCVEKIESNNKIGALTIAEESVARSFWEKVKAFERSFYNLEGDEITDAVRFFRKDVFEKMEGYDETITGPEDWAITEAIKKSKFLVARVNTLIYHYERITSLFSLLKKKYYYGLRSSVYLQKTQRSLISPKTIYFLRPIFYRNWQRMTLHPFLTISMFFMLNLEMIAGGLGYLKGKYSE